MAVDQHDGTQHHRTGFAESQGAMSCKLGFEHEGGESQRAASSR